MDRFLYSNQQELPVGPRSTSRDRDRGSRPGPVPGVDSAVHNRIHDSKHDIVADLPALRGASNVNERRLRPPPGRTPQERHLRGARRVDRRSADGPHRRRRLSTRSSAPSDGAPGLRLRRRPGVFLNLRPKAAHERGVRHRLGRDDSRGAGDGRVLRPDDGGPGTRRQEPDGRRGGDRGPVPNRRVEPARGAARRRVAVRGASGRRRRAAGRAAVRRRPRHARRGALPGVLSSRDGAAGPPLAPDGGGDAGAGGPPRRPGRRC